MEDTFNVSNRITDFEAQLQHLEATEFVNIKVFRHSENGIEHALMQSY